MYNLYLRGVAPGDPLELNVLCITNTKQFKVRIGCPRNLCNVSKGYFRHRTAVMFTNSVSIKRKVTNICPQGSCCRPGFWNLLYNSILKLELTSNSKIIAFANDLVILTRGESVVEAENYMNLEMRKILERAQNNKLKFNENKSSHAHVSQEKNGEKGDRNICKQQNSQTS
jgi:hypothetical protein